MRKVIVALLVGAVVGGVLFWFFGRSSAPEALGGAPIAAQGTPSTPRSAGAIVSNTGSRETPGLHVTVSRNGTAEANVRVELTLAVRDLARGQVAWQPLGAERTSAEGQAQFPTRAGRYLVVATAADGALAAQQVDVASAEVETKVTLSLEPPAIVTGQVVEKETRRPVAGAVVRAEPETLDEVPGPGRVAAASGRADSLGRFSLSVPRGSWRLVASGDGLLPEVLGVRAPAGGLEFELMRGVRLSGLVVESAGAPVADAQVRVSPGEPSWLSTDAAGRFEVLAPPSQVSVHATAADGRQALARVTLAKEPGRAEVKLVVGEGSTLEGLVRDAAGPVSGAEVHVLAEPENLELAALSTGADGRFAATRLPKGRYTVAAKHGEGRRAQVVGVELPGAAPVELVLPAAGRLTGLVLDESGNPVEGATVTLEWTSRLHEVPRSARSGPDGRFAFDDLPGAEVTASASFEGLTSDAQSPYVAAGGVAEITLRLTMLGKLVGTLTDSAVSRVMVKGAVSAGRRFPVGEFPGGRFSLDLPPGPYVVQAAVGPLDDNLVFMHVADVVIRAGEVTQVSVGPPGGDDAGWSLEHQMHQELGSGLSFENVAGGVRVDFLMGGCPAQVAGVRQGDLVVSLGGEPVRDAREAFQRVRQPVGTPLAMVVRRDGQDLPLTLR